MGGEDFSLSILWCLFVCHLNGVALLLFLSSRRLENRLECDGDDDGDECRVCYEVACDTKHGEYRLSLVPSFRFFFLRYSALLVIGVSTEIRRAADKFR